jgi:hypothetical protein
VCVKERGLADLWCCRNSDDYEVDEDHQDGGCVFEAG